MGHLCWAQAIGEQVSSTLAQATAQQRVIDCIRTLPILVSEASPSQIQQACQDKYGLEGSYVNACLVQIRQIYTAEGKSFPTDEWSLRSQCSAREPIAGITRQPFDEPKDTVATTAKRSSLIWPMQGEVLTEFRDGALTGLGIVSRSGSPVVAAADGKVGASVKSLFGFGNKLFVTSPASLIVYGNISKAFVKEGDMVLQGQKIAEISGEKPLFFFARVFADGKEVIANMLDFLPTR
jgi:murein DD-endopeptidase MepM/ murein hydrolase activator NlpD